MKLLSARHALYHTFCNKQLKNAVDKSFAKKKHIFL